MDDSFRIAIIGPLNDLDWPALCEIAQKGIEKLTVNELRAIVACGSTKVFWPGLITWAEHCEDERAEKAKSP